MIAAIITGAGGPEVLAIRDVPPPAPAPDEVLVRVRASALNRADLLQRAGRYPAPPGSPPNIPGIEFAGEIVRTGERAGRWRVGQRVFGIAGGGAHGEYLTAHERAVAEVPDVVGWREAGAVPEAFITAHDALVTQAALRPGERVLIHAVGSGVGLAAVQLVRAFGGIPYGTSRTADKVERARRLGLEDGVCLPEGADPVPEHVSGWTSGRGMDIVLDLVGGAYVTAGVASLAPKGRLILVGTVAGDGARLELGRVLRNRLTIRGTVLRARPLEEKILVTSAFAAEVVPLLAADRVHPVIDSVYPLAQIAEAHRRLEGNETFGKVVVEVG